MMPSGELDSSSHSDDGQSFQDAADGRQEEIGVEGEAGDESVERSSPRESQSTVVGTSATSASGTDTGALDKTDDLQKDTAKAKLKAKGIGGGVAALKARFESEQKAEAKAEKTDEARSIGNDETAEQAPDENTLADVSEKQEDGVEEEVDTKIPPSEGAQSLLDPTETIANPFAAGDTDLNDGADHAQLNPSTPQMDLRRFSGSSQDQASTAWGASIPDTPSAASRFSTVSLGTTQQSSSKRNTISAPAAHTSVTPDEQASGSSEFLARNTARLSTVEGQRRSLGTSEKFKEKLNELRHAHSREASLSRPSQEDGEASATGLDERNGNTGAGVPPTDEDRRSSWDGPPTDEMEEEHIDWDFWGDVMSNYQEIAQTQPRKLSRAIQAGIPAALRGMMWQLMSSSKDEEMEIIYAYYLKQTSPHEKMIRKDLARTFPGQDYFQDGKGIGQENLFNVVKAYSLYDEECGYCQGMQFVVGPLLLNMPDEEAFSTLVRLMKSYDLRGHFVPNMPSLQLHLFQFDRLLEEFLPLLHTHLVRHGIKSSMYASGWIMTLFTYRSPLSICFRILDSVFAEGIEALFRFALALMKKNEEQLLTMSFDEAVPLLAARVFDVYKKDMEEIEDGSRTPNAKRETNASYGSSDECEYRVGELVRDAFQFKITPFMLDSYASDFAEQVKAATAHRREVETLKVDNRSLQLRVKSLEDQLGAVQQEHVDLVKSLVMAKLAKEEMAEELMRYKMMYAEAALLVDQSGAGQQAQPISPSPSNGTSIRQSQ